MQDNIDMSARMMFHDTRIHQNTATWQTNFYQTSWLIIKISLDSKEDKWIKMHPQIINRHQATGMVSVIILFSQTKARIKTSE